MNRHLNVDLIKEAMDAVGFNNSQLAETLSVSRTIIGDWLTSKKFPRPDKLVRLGITLKLPHNKLVIDDAPVTAVVNFRRKAQRNLDEGHYAAGLKKAMLLDLIADYLPEGSLETPPTLKNPSLDYDYLQKAIALVRSFVGKGPEDAITYPDLIHIIHKYDVTPIPVFWGTSSDKDNDAHGLHVESPKSKRDWIYINLDSYFLDLKFWISHEIGHVVTKNTCSEDVSDDFADLFAQSFLFPKKMAEKGYEILAHKPQRQLIHGLIAMAEPLNISPYTIYKSINLYASATKREQLPSLGKSYVGIKSYVEGKSTLLAKLIEKCPECSQRQGGTHLTPKDYIHIAEKYFKTPVFDSIKMFLMETMRGDGFLQSLLDIQAVEAKELHHYLTH